MGEEKKWNQLDFTDVEIDFAMEIVTDAILRST
jgi:hypothetical protein